MELEGANIWYWIILPFVGIIAAVLGYFFGKSDAPSTPDFSEQISILEIENAKLKSDLDTCKKRLSATKPPKISEEPSISNATKHYPVFAAEEAKLAFGAKVKEDDLKIVEGIGPKIEGLFHSFNIKTWKDLSETSADKCQEVLDSGGKRYRIHDPASWPMQAKMAYEGHWKQLADWQVKHRAGKF
jgi:Uncharacterized conserved protein